MSGSRRIFCVAIMTFLLAPLIVSAQQSPVQVPETPAGDKLAKLVQAFNSGDEGMWKQFVEQEWAPSDQEGAMERRLMFFQRVSAEMGGMDIYRIDDSKDFH